MAQELDKSVVEGLLPPASGNRILYDEEVKGFGVRVTSGGAKAFILNYRNAGGRERRITIGSWPAWKVKDAREQAKALKQKVDLGQDPVADRQAKRADPTVAGLAQLYREKHLPKKRAGSREGDEAMLARHILPALGRLQVAEIRRKEIAHLHRKLSETIPIAANRCLALLSKMFGLAMEEEWRGDNPCKGIQRNQENRLERYLTPAEIAQLAAALAAHPERTSCNAIRLLLLTGARKGETLAAKWSEFDLEAGVWVKPSAHTKSKRTHRVPLSAPAKALLSAMKSEADASCPYVFPGQLARELGPDGLRHMQPLKDIKRVWAAVCQKAGLGEMVAGKAAGGKPAKVWKSNARMHDLRHTYASLLASSGLSLPIIGGLLGHTQPQTTARYAHLMDDPLRAATERVGVIVSGGKAGEVVDFGKARA